jgi:hypothetical protein
MTLPRFTHINYAPITVVLLSVFCWVALYSVYANLGQVGFDLMQGPGVILNVEGVLLVGLHAAGLLLLVTLALGSITVMTRLGIRSAAQADPPSTLQRPL